MNIEHILRKLSSNHSQKQSSRDPMQTSQSIGTFNDQHDTSQRSFAIHQEVIPYVELHLKDKQLHRKNTSYSNHNHNNLLKNDLQLDKQLKKIEQMKFLYESRSRKANRSIQGSNSSAKRSVEKHHLKPSITPSFSKFNKIPLKTNKSLVDNQSKYNMVTILNNQMQSHNQIKSPLKMKPKHLVKQEYLYPDQQNNDPPSTCYYHSTQNNLEELPDFISHRKSTNCQCKHKIISMENQIKYLHDKLQNMEKKINNIQSINQQINYQKQELANMNKELLQHLCKSDKQKLSLILGCEQFKNQKQELQSILKQILYKRQIERLHNMKQNTNKTENQKNAMKIKQSREISNIKIKTENLMNKNQK